MVNKSFLQFIAILCLLIQEHILGDEGLNSQSIASQAEALLEFKHGLKDPSNLLSSWTLGKDCCHWKGVGCNTTTGVIPNCWTYGTNMIILNLAKNNLIESIPDSFGSLLNLHMNFFDGNIPTSLCQLKSLYILDLSENQLKGEIPRCVFPAMATKESINEKSYMEFLTIKESLSIYLSETERPLLIQWKRWTRAIYVTVVVTLNKLRRKLHTQQPPM
ncbi:endo-1,4-beta-xylanase [Trifolium repens]|nr:endo-1,4-beta-xylanase [Trifolium repens]